MAGYASGCRLVSCLVSVAQGPNGHGDTLACACQDGEATDTASKLNAVSNSESNVMSVVNQMSRSMFHQKRVQPLAIFLRRIKFCSVPERRLGSYLAPSNFAVSSLGRTQAMSYVDALVHASSRSVSLMNP